MNPKMFGIAFKIFPLVLSAVDAVEKFLVAKKGKDKQDAAVGMINVLLQNIESGLDKDLVNNAEVEAALRAAIDAVVALENVVAKVKAAAKP